MTTTTTNFKSLDGPSHATVFIWLFAISSIWHYTSSASDIASYWFQYNPLVTPLIFISIGTGFLAACFPDKTRALLWLSIGQLAAIGLRFPFVADHRVMEMFLSLSIVLSYCYLAFGKRSFKVGTTEMFEVFSPIGRWLLIIMYFYGTFHKINAGFLSPQSSGAIPFLNGFPLPASFLKLHWIQYAAIYGTLIFEFVAMLLLLSARTKYYGMLLGMSFHFMVGISGYGTLAHFSAFALALHALFLPADFGKRVYADPLVPAFFKDVQRFKVLSVVFVLLQVGLAIHMFLSATNDYINSLFAVFGLSLLILVFRHGRLSPVDAPYRLKSSFAFANLIPVWFFLHCLSPYIGLGTGGTIAMFSGLRTEGGVSNHYIIREPIRLFPYQDRIVYIERAENPSLQEARGDRLGVVMFDFQRHFMTREPLILPLRVRVGDVSYVISDESSLVKFGDKYFAPQSWLERRYMSFRLVDDPKPNQCRH
jgi:hypothetical protein